MLILSADMFIALDKDANGTLSKQELREYADGTLTEIFIERGTLLSICFLKVYNFSWLILVCHSSDEAADFFLYPLFAICCTPSLFEKFLFSSIGMITLFILSYVYDVTRVLKFVFVFVADSI